MNRPLRKVAAACLALFALLLVQANWVQVVKAKEYRNDPRNRRVLLRTYDRERGPIVIGTGKGRQAVAKSIATKDPLKYLRTYPGGPSYAPVTGFASLVYGYTGIESQESSVLSGEDDRLFVRRLSDYITGRQIVGGSVVLTLDRDAQQAAYDGLAGKVGAVVALNPRTGAVLAMASRPSYDPTGLSSHDPSKIRSSYKALVDDSLDPLVNRAVEERHSPGSTFKVITAAAALAKGYHPETVIDSPPSASFGPGKPIRNFAGETCGANSKETLAAALATSCNTAFAILGTKVGQAAIEQQAEAFGFGRGDLRLPQHVATSIVTPNGEPLPTVFLAQSAIGQKDVQATPLQMAMVAAGVANGGEVMRPYLVQEVQGPDLTRLDHTSPEVYSKAISASVAQQLTAMMLGVVTNGTGTSAQINGVQVAGKTGTAQGAAGQRPNVWFIGFAPANDPQVAVAVFLDRRSGYGSDATGGRLAAPIARAVMQAVLGHG
ncbi:MAG: cell elongation-specific peptidoglycan D,D-transpeptidase [Frankiales bacterium]|nr:cell elongation-specific peptidoglycan D,D-transpeptidase [Frankiales bacterium]